MSIGIAETTARIRRSHLARNSAELIVRVAAEHLPENADPIEFWGRMLDLVQDMLDVETATEAKRRRRSGLKHHQQGKGCDHG